MSSIQKFIWCAVSSILMVGYVNLVQMKIIPKVLAKQWMILFDVTSIITAIILSFFSFVVFLMWLDATSPCKKTLNEMYDKYPNSNKISTWTPWVFVILFVAAFQLQMYGTALMCVLLFSGTYKTMQQYTKFCKKAEYVDITNMAKQKEQNKE